MPPIEAVVATEEKKSVVGFIYPPPEVRSILLIINLLKNTDQYFYFIF